MNSSFTYADIPGLTIYTSGRVEVTQQFDLKKFMVRTMGTISYPAQLADSLHWEDFESHAVLQAKTGMLTGGQVTQKLTKFSGAKKAGDDFTVSWDRIDHAGTITPTGTTTFGSISASKEENNRERGRLGEAATFLTMMDFGYVPFRSKYEKDHGFDGLFKRWDGKFLFITESKCRQESASAQKYLAEGLSEKEINSKLKTMHTKDGVVKESAEEVDLFIQDGPDSIFKFAHRIKPDGKCQCAVVPFSGVEYAKCLPPVVRDYTTEAHQVELMSETCGVIDATPAEMLRAFMIATNLKAADVANMMKTKAFQAIGGQ